MATATTTNITPVSVVSFPSPPPVGVYYHRRYIEPMNHRRSLAVPKTPILPSLAEKGISPWPHPRSATRLTASFSNANASISSMSYGPAVTAAQVVTHHGAQPKRKPASKTCKIEGCEKMKQTRGLCKLHGGGSRCSVEGCTKTNQGGGYCRGHGGGKRCVVEGCIKGAQRGGLCHGHGGIRYCSVPNCDRKDRGSGFCAGHGGGKKCSHPGCKKLARRQGMCTHHLSVYRKAAETTTAEQENAPNGTRMDNR